MVHAALPIFALLGGLLGVTFFLVLLFAVPLSFVVWVLALVSCIRHETASDNTKVIWVLIILFLHFFGGLAYLLIRRPQRIRELGH